MCVPTLKQASIHVSEGTIKHPVLGDLNVRSRTFSGSGGDEIQTTSVPITSREDATHTRGEQEPSFLDDLLELSTEEQNDHEVNDYKVQEEIPRREDHLTPQHGHIDSPEEAELAADEIATKKSNCVQGTTSAEDEASNGKESCGRSAILAETVIPAEPAKPRREVRFGTVLVRDYGMILGDNPCCSCGPPVTIGWEYSEYEPLDVTKYELLRRPRRRLRCMRLDSYRRTKLLSNAGYTQADFQRSEREVKQAKMRRRVTQNVVSRNPLLKAADVMDSAIRKLKRLLKEECWKRQDSLHVI